MQIHLCFQVCSLCSVFGTICYRAIANNDCYTEKSNFFHLSCQVYKFIILNLKHEKNCFSLTIIIAVKCLATFQVCEWTACWAARSSHIASERRVCCWQHLDSSKCFATCARGSRRIFTKKKSNSVIKRNSCASVGSRKLRVSSLPSSDSGSRLSLPLFLTRVLDCALSWVQFRFVLDSGSATTTTSAKRN